MPISHTTATSGLLNLEERIDSLDAELERVEETLKSLEGEFCADFPCAPSSAVSRDRRCYNLSLHAKVSLKRPTNHQLLPGRSSRAICSRIEAFEKPLPKRPPFGGLHRATFVDGNRASTFGKEIRFRSDETGKCLASHTAAHVEIPSCDFLSTKTRVPSAVIPPLPDRLKGALDDPAKKWLSKVCAEAGVDLTTANARIPGFRALQGDLLAFIREEFEQHNFTNVEELASTSAGSDGPNESICSISTCEGIWSNVPEPGPGSYSPDFNLTSAKTKGTPFFSRYSAREGSPRKKQAGHTSESIKREAEPDLIIPCSTLSTRGGKINPNHGLALRAPSAGMADAVNAANRPFYQPDSVQVDSSMTAVNFADGAELGRLESAKVESGPGPGAYDIRPDVPPNHGPTISPEVCCEELQRREHAKERYQPPGPGFYERSLADGHVYPNARLPDLDRCVGHEMAFQRPPDHTADCGDLSPKWGATRNRSFSAIVLPEGRRARRYSSPGPGSYMRRAHFYDVDDQAVRCLRPDDSVVQWVQPRSKSQRIRLDSRSMLSLDADLFVRPRGRAAVIQPFAEKPRRRSWAPGDHWQLYDGGACPEPLGLATFSRQILFEQFLQCEKRWNYLEQRSANRQRMSARLSYDFPKIETLRERAPQYDFGALEGRPVEDAPSHYDSPREGDVLLLSPGWKLERPGPISLVDMARQFGRQNCLAGNDDFEELVLSPKVVGKRTNVFVDMARAVGRPERFDFSANIRVQDGDVKYTFHPSSKNDPSTDDALLIAPLPGDGLRRGVPECNFSLALGRKGIDPRIAETDTVAADSSVLLTEWKPRFSDKDRPSVK